MWLTIIMKNGTNRVYSHISINLYLQLRTGMKIIVNSFFLSPEPDTGHPFWHCDFANIKQAVKHIYGDQWNFFQLISICLTRNSALVIRLWSGVDTTADEKSLSRRTIRTNACAQGKIIEFLSILHYNESLDISTDRALRTLQHR